MSEEIKPILSHLLAGVAGGFIGGLVTHLFTKSRDHRKVSSDKISELVTFLRKWEEQVRAYPQQAAGFHSSYKDSWPNVKEAAGKLELCFTVKKQAVFRSLVDAACNVCGRNWPGNIEEVEGAKKRIFEAIRSLESFAKRHGHGRWFRL